MGVVADPGVAEQAGQPLGDQDPDLVHGAAELQDAHVETGLRPLEAVPVVGQLLLGGGTEIQKELRESGGERYREM